MPSGFRNVVRLCGAAWMLLGVASVSLTLSGPAYATSLISLSLSPAEVVLASGGSASGTILVENSSPDSRQVSLSAQPSDSTISVPQLAQTQFEIPANGSKSVAYTVHRSDEASADKQTVNFVASSENSAAVVTLTINAVEVTEMLQAEFKPILGTLNEYRPGQTTLIITNKRNSQLEIGGITVTAPADVKLVVSCNANSTNVAPGTTETIRVDACAGRLGAGSQAAIGFRVYPEQTLAPGPRSLTVVISATPAQGQSTPHIVTGDFILEVFAESAILTAIGVPIFLLLPGVIILLTTSFLIVRASKWRFTGDPVLKLSFNTAALDVLLGIAISLVFALLYPRLTEILPGKQRNYLLSLGFDDFYWVFFWSFAIGVAAWLLAVISYEITSGFRYEPNDQPEDILRKMSMRSWLGGARVFMFARVGGGDEALKAVILPRRVGGTEKFVSPRVEVRPLVQGGSSELESLRLSIESDKRCPGLMAKILKFKERKLLSVRFSDGDIPAPRIATREDIHELGADRSFVEWTPSQ